jgi:predicted  nucleic acid-binding Zn-ribbon protein
MTTQYQPDLFDDEWDKMAHTPDEYRREIRQLRERCYKYAKELDELRVVVGNLRADLEALSSEMERMERQR